MDARVHDTRDVPAWWDVRDPFWTLNYDQFPKAAVNGVDCIIHLAAQVSVSDSATDPQRYIQQNTEATAVFLKRLIPFAGVSLKRLVVASSMSVYGEGGVLVKEDQPVCPTSVYGLTKYDQERLCMIWGSQVSRPVAALRFFNVYGPGQNLKNPYTGVLANFANWLLNDERPKVFEDGMQTRDFIHVRDVANAVVLAATNIQDGVFNVCTGKATSILEAGTLLAKAMGSEIKPVVTGETRVGDIRHCTGSPVKAAKQLGFIARTSFKDGIREYAAGLVSRV